MRTILFIIQKEFIQIFRNRMMMPIIFVVPLVQMLILVHAATFEMRNIKVSIIDLDMTSSSRKMISKFEGSPFFRIVQVSFSDAEAEHEIRRGNVDMILHVPYGFEKKLIKENKSPVQVVINAINGASAGLISAYTTRILMDFNRGVLLETQDPSRLASLRTIEIQPGYWYNPKLNYKTYMVPGILALLVTIIGLMLTGMNIVREKEIGTIEQINVTPIRRFHFVIGKLMPFWVIAMFEMAFGLTLGKLIFDIPIIGSIGLIFVCSGVYIFVILGFGLLVSTMTNTQQQAMLVSFFFMMIFILMSGLFTSIESMPAWAQQIDRLNPVAYLIRIMRMVMLKGSGFTDIRDSFYSLVVYAFASISVAVWRYRKVA